MPKISPIQHSFVAGELSPRLKARADLDMYHHGLHKALNAIPVSQGPILNTKGLRYWGTIPGNDGRLFTFQRSAEEAYIVIISDDGFLYVTDEASNSLGPELISNGDFENGLQDWIAEADLGTVEVVGDMLILTNSNNPNRGTVYAYQYVPLQNPGEVHYINVDMPDDDGNTIELRVGTTPDSTDLLQLSGGGTSLVGEFTPTTDFYVTLWKAGGGGITSKRINEVSCRIEVEGTGYVTFAHPWTSDLKLIHAKMPPGIDSMYFAHPSFPPQKLAISAGDVWSFAAVAFTGTPGHWGPDYPRTLAFFEGRSWWGGPGETMNASQSGSYEDLTTGTQADDGMEFTISKRGEIMWMEGLRNLLIGTRTSEHIVTSQGGIIIPGDIQVEQQSSYGSNYAQPVQLGNKAAYCTRDGRKLLDIGYQWTAEQWLSEDLLYNSEHLTKLYDIEEIHWQQNPEKYLFCILSNGAIISCLYDPIRQVIGWVRFITDGLIRSSTTAEVRGESIAFCLVRRFNGMFIETLGDDSHMDSSKSEYSAAGKNTIDDGLHLANETVGVKIDGAVHPDVLLSDTGTATLNWTGNFIEYGLKYKTVIELMPRDFPPSAEGSAMSMKKRWNKVWLRLYKSVIPKVEGKMAPDRHPSTLMNNSEDVFTGDLQISTLGYGDGTLIISNEFQLPLNIIGIFGEMEVDRI